MAKKNNRRPKKPDPSKNPPNGFYCNGNQMFSYKTFTINVSINGTYKIVIESKINLLVALYNRSDENFWAYANSPIIRMKKTEVRTLNLNFSVATKLTNKYTLVLMHCRSLQSKDYSIKIQVPNQEQEISFSDDDTFESVTVAGKFSKTILTLS